MSTTLKSLLNSFRDAAVTEREKGTYFENLVRDFLTNDPLYKSQFSEVLTFADWAKAQGKDGKDVGIDLVARIRGEDGFCAIQCKFYAEDYSIQKSDIDSFFTASGKEGFTRRLIVDSTRKAWSSNAEDALDGQTVPATRISLSDLEASKIDWSKYKPNKRVVSFAQTKSLREHQEAALKNVQDGFKSADRGKLIMACGTGKTFTSLKIAEAIAGKGGRVLYLVPSLALMSQTVREWSNDTEVPLNSFAVCSDSQVGKRKVSNDDVAEINSHDLAYPATTKPDRLASKVTATHDVAAMTIVFSTYQSIQVISEAQLKHGLDEFDLIICDEAHRTTGATFLGEEASNFVKVHDQQVIQGKKRLYMTATPRIFGDAVKSKADEHSVELCSMDDESLFGKTFHTVNFTYAVQNDLLTDYKVIILAMDEEEVSDSLQARLADEDSSLKLDDVTKIIGCYKALTKQNLKKDLIADPNPMHRALAFCRDINSSKAVRNEFSDLIDEFLEENEGEEPRLNCEVRHVDGTYNAKTRQERLDWLSEDAGDDECRILTNARCLSEGVDVPSLDAILFMHPRKSQIDVVQSVGRVMRRAEGKKLGYVILPIGIPAGETPSEALNNNKKYQVVWQILNALRAHDDRLEAEINSADYGVDLSNRIEIIAEIKDIKPKDTKEEPKSGIGEGSAKDDDVETSIPMPKPQQGVQLVFDEFSKAILAKIVKKCGTRGYWIDWANGVADVAKSHITRIKSIIKSEGTKERRAFDDFLVEIRDDLNDSITREEAIEMLAQHIITKPVFDALFEGYSFAENNPVSKAMQQVLNVLDEHNLDKESESLDKFYADVRLRVEKIDSIEGKQKLLLELYNSFFKNAFSRLTSLHGIVYTPIEVVDFIIHSVNDVLKSEFGQTLGSKGVHIIDPFVGTGTFITRLLQSGLIKPEELEHKYKNEIHANELVLLAYYIGAINIEQVYHSLSKGDYEPFEGICLTDTFEMYESDDLVSYYMPDNSERRKRQKRQDIKVVIGNPPYSAGQRSANDDAQNVTYEHLDSRIAETYAARTEINNKRALYDSYIRAIRWASDRLIEKAGAGVMAFVTNAGWVDGNAMDGLRKCLAEDFTSIYVFHLRGNARTQGEQRRKESGNVFGEGSRAPVAISIMVRNPEAKEHGKIYFHDIGDYLDRKEKLNVIRGFGSVEGISNKSAWNEITPNKHGDWLAQRAEGFEKFIKIGDKKSKSEVRLFSNYSAGLQTNRDAWCYNYSKSKLSAQMQRMISFFNGEVRRFVESGQEDARKFVAKDPKKIKWSSSLIPKVQAGITSSFDEKRVFPSIYRPYCKQLAYHESIFNHRVYQMPQIFPDVGFGNKVICVTGIGARDFSTLMSAYLPCLDILSKSQCFPLKLYEKQSHEEGSLLADAGADEYQVRDGISNEGLKHFQAAYPGEDISKEDVFYYVYGLLHSEEYRARFNDNLSKELPRIPCVKKAKDFWAFSRAGWTLGDLHVDYDEVEPYAVTIVGDPRTDEDYYVKKMKFGGKGRDKDKSTIVYNSNITVTDIPLEAYDYVVNGRSAIEWVMDRQGVSVDTKGKSGIVNDANDYALETMGDAAYPLKLLQRVITVSLETMKIVRSLPKLDI